MLWYFVFFFISGFCSVLYELVWLRLSMAQFGVTSAMVSIVLSVFMAGLGLGSWASGAWIRRRGEKLGMSPLLPYAAIELLIGVSGILVPYELRLGHSVLERLGSTSSSEYYLVSGIWVAITLIPWCTLMGATIPVAMLAIGRMFPRESSRSFSFLYMANVAGAVVGTGLPLILIELLGFRGTLNVGAACNILIAVMAAVASRRPLTEPAKTAELLEEVRQPSHQLAANSTSGGYLLVLLFATGLTSMGMEVVWVREFTPYIGTVVYAFAGTLAVYLTGTFIGSRIYRSWSSESLNDSSLLWTLLALCSLFPLLAASPNIHIDSWARLVAGIAPFTGLLGYLTPMLVDRWAGGDPAKAGKAYAVNVVGCIVGPLVAGFLLLPWISERWALVLLSLPWLIVGLRLVRLPGPVAPSFTARAASYLLLPLVVGLFWGSKGFEKQYRSGGRVLRDSTATVIATGTGMTRLLMVNGYGMTSLTPITKMMAHLPLAFLDRPPQDALVICFGIGTTFRSLHSWGIPVTAVELVPSVPRLFYFFHSDAPEILKSPLSHVVIDDGRRYLERTTQQYDVITIDPPPPVEAAGSSLLYSEDFYTVIRQRLRPGGILQQWLPIGDPEDVAAVALALRHSFPYVRVFAFGKNWGFHFLASDRPIPVRTAKELADRLPAAANADLVEWDAQPDAEARFAHLLNLELPIDQLIAGSPATPALSDDRPINEYYLVRKELRP